MLLQTVTITTMRENDCFNSNHHHLLNLTKPALVTMITKCGLKYSETFFYIVAVMTTAACGGAVQLCLYSQQIEKSQ